MPATPARIAKSTVDGQVVERVSPGLKQLHQNAVDMPERETFFDDPVDCQAMQDELWTWRSDPARIREAVEFDAEAGQLDGLAPNLAAPLFLVVDDTRAIADYGASRSYAGDYESERFALELIGLGDSIPPVDPLTIGGVPDTSAELGDNYLFTPHAAGGQPPYLFSLTAPDGVPKNLVFDRLTGSLSGTIATGVYGALGISGTPDTTAPPGADYSWRPTVTGGVPILIFSVAEPLPPGLHLDPLTGEIFGRPD